MAARHTRIVDRAITRLKLKQLRLLVAVGEFGSIQHAARELQISQPAATKLIQDLELDFEVQLFRRTNRGVIPDRLRTGADSPWQADHGPGLQCRPGTR